MLETKKTLDLSAQELDLLEGALQTQIKILSLEVQAGTGSAKLRLNDVKSMLTQIDRLRGPARPLPSPFSWLQQSLGMS